MCLAHGDKEKKKRINIGDNNMAVQTASEFTVSYYKGVYCDVSLHDMPIAGYMVTHSGEIKSMWSLPMFNNSLELFKSFEQTLKRLTTNNIITPKSGCFTIFFTKDDTRIRSFDKRNWKRDNIGKYIRYSIHITELMSRS
jgi:hypothetical protein